MLGQLVTVDIKANVIESTFSAVHLRTYNTRGCCKEKSILSLVFKLVELASRRWQKLHVANIIPPFFRWDEILGRSSGRSRCRKSDSTSCLAGSIYLSLDRTYPFSLRSSMPAKLFLGVGSNGKRFIHLKILVV
jgi:hypothetical protein